MRLRIGCGLGSCCRCAGKAGLVAAAGVITIANWLACDDRGTRGTGSASRGCGGILRMGLVRGRGGGDAAAVNALSGCTQVTTTETPRELQTKCHLIASRY